MRLGKLLDILETTLPKLTISKKVLDQHSVKIDNIAALLEVIESLSVLPSLEKIATNAIGFMPIPDKTGSARVHTERFAPVETLINALRSQASQLLQVLTSIMVPSVENTVYFKIPQQSDLSGLSTVINTIDVAFQQILNSIDKETTIKFKGFDTGSDWLILLVGGKIWLVLKIIDYVMKLAAQGIDLRKQYLALENLGLDTAVKKQQLEIQKIQIE